MSKQTSEESGREGTLENKSSFVPTHNREAQLIHDIKKKHTSVFLGLATGKKEVIRDTESFSPIVHSTACSAAMSRDRLHGWVTHSYQKLGGGSLQKGLAQNIPLALKEAESQ